jgi:PTH1 family peptidyl-tRNA hydrolase
MSGLLSWIRARLGGAPVSSPGASTELAQAPDQPMKLIVGMGNPGKEYEHTRHNVGWWMVDHLAEVWHFEPWRKDGEARIADGRAGNVRVRLVKPQTYMNLSGAVLRPYLRRPFWSAATDLMIVVDEVALPIGRYRFRADGSAGGHNGLKSIETTVGNQKYPRLRIGVGPDNQRQVGNLSDFVLDNFGKAETATVKELLPVLAEALDLWMKEGITPVMNRFSGKQTD